MNKLIVTDETPFPVQPKDIDATKHLFEAFDNTETEVSARYIVALCQQLGGWVPFTKEQIDAHSKQNFHFNRLIEPELVWERDSRHYAGGGWLVQKDGKFYVTVDFICRCLASSPAAKLVVLAA